MMRNPLEQVDGSARKRSLVFNALGHFSNDGMNNFVPIVAAILEAIPAKGFSLFYVGIVTPVFYIASTLLSTFVGRLADRGTNPGLLIALGILFLSSGLFGFYIGLVYLAGPALIAVVLISGLIMGFGSSVYHPISGTIMRQTFTTKNRGRAMGVVGAAGTVGSTIYPSLFVLSALLLTDSGSLLLLVALGFASSFAIWRGLKVVRLARQKKKKEEEEEEVGMSRTRAALTKGIVVLTLVTAVRSVATSGVTAFLPVYIATQKGAGVGPLLGFTLSAMYAAGIFGQLFFGAMMDRFDKRLVLGVGSLGSALATVGYVLTGGPVELLFIALFGFFTYSNFPTLLTLASEYVSEGSSSLGNAFVWGYGITGGNVVGPALVTAIVVNNSSQLSFAFLVMAAIGLAGGFVTPMMPRPAGSRKVVLPQHQ
jgi:MFS transporter, FSR family, fosmidomycin resistance protein